MSRATRLEGYRPQVALQPENEDKSAARTRWLMVRRLVVATEAKGLRDLHKAQRKAVRGNLLDNELKSQETS